MNIDDIIKALEKELDRMEPGMRDQEWEFEVIEGDECISAGDFFPVVGSIFGRDWIVNAQPSCIRILLDHIKELEKHARNMSLARERWQSDCDKLIGDRNRLSEVVDHLRHAQISAGTTLSSDSKDLEIKKLKEIIRVAYEDLESNDVHGAGMILRHALKSN